MAILYVNPSELSVFLNCLSKCKLLRYRISFLKHVFTDKGYQLILQFEIYDPSSGLVVFSKTFNDTPDFYESDFITEYFRSVNDKVFVIDYIPHIKMFKIYVSPLCLKDFYTCLGLNYLLIRKD